MKTALKTPPEPSQQKPNASARSADDIIAAPSPKTPPPGPTDVRTLGHRPTHAAGINAIAAMQILLGAFMVFMVISRNGSPGLSLTATAANLLPPALLVTSGAGLIRRTGWGWWSACALFYFGWIQAFVAVVYSLGGFAAVDLAAAVPLLAVFTIVLMYLNKACVMTAIHCPESTEPVLRSRVTPATAGFLLALLISLPHVMGH